VEDFEDATVSPRSNGSLQSEITRSTQALGEGSGGQGAEDDERQVFSSSAQESSSSAQPVSEPSQSPPRAAPDYREDANEESDENGNQNESDSAEPSAAALTPVQQQHTLEQEQDNALCNHGGAEADCSSSRTPSSVADKGEEVEGRALSVVSHLGTSSSVTSQASAGVGAVSDSAPAGLDGSNGYGVVDG
jgi:hypothetical protein